MPRVVDREDRRRQLGAAVWRVVRDEGVEQASVRNVAREAGLSTGSLRHYFASQSDLLRFAMHLVIERLEARVAALDLPDDPLAAARTALAQLLPLDPERAVENEVWLAFSVRAMVDDDLRALRDDAFDRLRAACHRWAGALLADASPEVVDLEAERLFALVDGLAVHAALRPEAASAPGMQAVLDLHLEALAQKAVSPPGSPRTPRRGDRRPR